MVTAIITVGLSVPPDTKPEAMESLVTRIIALVNGCDGPGHSIDARWSAPGLRPSDPTMPRPGRLTALPVAPLESAETP